MSVAQLGDWTFQLAPQSVEWDFSVKTSVQRTVGGKVVQVLGVNLGDLRMVGKFGSGGLVEQRRFVEWFHEQAKQQADGIAFEPLRFLFPHREWDMQVYLKKLTEPGGSRSVKFDVGNFNPEYALTLHITEDHSRFSIASATQLGYIERISREFGWERTKYNGPMTPEEVSENLGGRSIDEALGLYDMDVVAGQESIGVGDTFSFDTTAPPQDSGTGDNEDNPFVGPAIPGSG